ncbi:MAG: UDP-N-acetylglucosamine pyrophosphorylase [Clostridia bacterium]|nr:UDP-N-acetylglucosamine pyrophosphorylase [Clostridia bacterium]
MENCTNVTVRELYSLEQYLAKELFKDKTYPWEVLPLIADFILSLAPHLDPNEYELCTGADGKQNIWIAKTAKVASDAHLYGPLIIDHETEVRHGAFIRGKVIIGKKCVIGNSTEIKNSVIMDNVQLPHYNYVGDSVVGNYAHLGAGAIISNLKSTKTQVIIGGEFETDLRKAGAFIGDHVEIGCNSVLNPGTVIGKSSIVYPVSCVRGIIPANVIVSTKLTITQKEKKK